MGMVRRMSMHVASELKRFNYLLGELQAAYHDASVKLGISDSVSNILYTICDAGGKCPIHAICRQTGLSKQTVNSALRKLENDGVVYLEAADKKTKNVCLTDAGKQFADRTAMRIIEMENEILQSWDRQDVKNYLSLTEKFLRDLQEKVERF